MGLKLISTEKLALFMRKMKDKGAFSNTGGGDSNCDCDLEPVYEQIDKLSERIDSINVGGGGGSSYGNFKVTNNTGWLSKAIPQDSECVVTLSWYSVEDGVSTGNGALSIEINDVAKVSREIEQGEVPFDIGPYLTTGINKISVTISDVYGSSRTIYYTVNVVSINITSLFDPHRAYTGEIPFSYTPVGAIEKTVHFLIDNTEIGTQIVTASNREQPYTIPTQAHGSHKFEVYFTGEIDGQNVESNHLIYDLICYEEGNTAPIITTSFNAASVKQHSTVVIPYIVYTPNTLTSEIQLKDGDTVVKTLTVDRTQKSWAYKANTAGAKTLYIVCGDTVKTISFSVTASNIDVTAESKNLELYLTSEGRSNNEASPLTWDYGGISAEFTGFNLKSDGWKNDENGNTVLRVSGDARVRIPFNIFSGDLRTTGKTVEIEFATRDVMDYDAVVLSCWDGERGIQITAQKALLKSEQSEVFTQYKENEHIRVTFCIEKRSENRLLYIYINGIMSGVVQYPDGDDFSLVIPEGIAIGSNDCTTDIYCIRVYGNNLSRYQILDNWIADTQDIDDMTTRYTRNDVFDDYGNIVISKLPKDIPYLVINSASYGDLPQSKGDKKTVSGFYVDPLNTDRSFTFEGAEIDVQGTSSQYYSRKNYKIKFKEGFVIKGTPQEKYQLRPTSMPTDTFTFKADVASSEGANNVELTMLYNDVCPVKTPPQQTDSRVRQGIEGYPCLAFYYDGTNYNFIGKYNFNNDKATEEVFGFEDGDESWEILQNNTEMVIWKDDNFSGDGWKTSFEGRYPDKNTDTTRLAAFASWLKSTDTTTVVSTEEKAARLAKFKAEFADWCNVDAMLFNYIFTELFLMVDNRAKNAFPTRYDEDGKWLILPYDYDTAMGINNEGELKFGYELEDTDTINGNNVFNGQDSVLYVNMRLAYADEIMEMYRDLRTNDMFSYDEVEKRFENHQSVWGESIFNEDARFKYIDPLVNEGNKTYLPMLQGSKAEQRKWWLYNRFRYIDSKYNAGDAQEDYVMLRSYAVADIEVTPYADIYAAAKFDSALVKERALRGRSYTLKNPLSGGRDAVISIYSASQLLSLGDLSGLKPGMADFSKATKLSSLKVGSGESGYNNPNLTDLTIGNLTLLKTLDVRNCSKLTQAVDVSGCTNIEHIYLEGTATTGVKLPDGGMLKTLHLPETVTNLTILNQKHLTDFVHPNFAKISTLRLEGNNPDLFDTREIIERLRPNTRVRVLGVDWNAYSVDEIYDLYDKLDMYRGLDENNNNLDRAVVSGTIHIDAIGEEDLKIFANRYPNITIDYKAITPCVAFVVDGKTISRQYGFKNDAIIVPDDPVKMRDVGYTYEFKGWSIDGENTTIVNGFMGESSVTYTALFNAIPRKYPIRFCQGSMVLQSYNVAYGELPVYTGSEPTKDSDFATYAFVGWDPEITPVTGAMEYQAQFKEIKVGLEAYSWEDISAISEEGLGENYFAVGDRKSIELKGRVGPVELNDTYYVYIIGFNHNAELEGNGIHFGTFKTALKNGTDICLSDYMPTYEIDGYSIPKFSINHGQTNTNHGGWKGCDMRYDLLGSTDIAPSDYGAYPKLGRVGYDPSDTCTTNPVANTLMAALPADLRAVMKPMTKYTDNKGGDENLAENVTASIDYLPLLSLFEVYGEARYANKEEQNVQKQYDYYALGHSTAKFAHCQTSMYKSWATRSACYGFGPSNWYFADRGDPGVGSAPTGTGIAPIFKV